MKKITIILLTTLFVICFYSCSKTESADGKPSETIAKGSVTYYSVSAVDYYAGGMHYKVFNSGSGSVFVVNLTKDSLDIAKKH